MNWIEFKEAVNAAMLRDSINPRKTVAAIDVSMQTANGIHCYYNEDGDVRIGEMRRFDKYVTDDEHQALLSALIKIRMGKSG